jgi:hypothetical protein
MAWPRSCDASLSSRVACERRCLPSVRDWCVIRISDCGMRVSCEMMMMETRPMCNELDGTGSWWSECGYHSQTQATAQSALVSESNHISFSQIQISNLSWALHIVSLLRLQPAPRLIHRSRPRLTIDRPTHTRCGSDQTIKNAYIWGAAHHLHQSQWRWS